MVKDMVRFFIFIASRFLGPAGNPWKGLFVDGAQMKDGQDENIEAFWIDNDDVSQCENNLMVTKSLKTWQKSVYSCNAIATLETYMKLYQSLTVAIE